MKPLRGKKFHKKIFGCGIAFEKFSSTKDLEIKNRYNGEVIFSHNCENNTVKITVEWAVKQKANLTKANLTEAKEDLFSVLRLAVLEIPFLKTALLEGRVNGSTYNSDGCGCLNGTLCIAAREKKDVVDALKLAQNSKHPIERLFIAIQIGNTPQNNPISKIVLGWIEEFESSIGR